MCHGGRRIVFLICSPYLRLFNKNPTRKKYQLYYHRKSIQFTDGQISREEGTFIVTKWHRGTSNSRSNFLQLELQFVGVEQDNWYISVRQLPPSCPPTTIRLFLSWFKAGKVGTKEVAYKARGNEGPENREISKEKAKESSYKEKSFLRCIFRSPTNPSWIIEWWWKRRKKVTKSKAYLEVDEAQNFLHFSTFDPMHLSCP